MKAKIQKLGSTHGVVIPTSLLDDLDVVKGDPVDLVVKNGKIVVTLLREPRHGWAEDSKRLAAMGEESLAWPEFPNQGDRGFKWKLR